MTERDKQRNRYAHEHTSLRLTIVPTTLKAANAYIAQYHRHNRPVPGCISVVGVSDGERLRGVAVVGRPIARALDDGFTAEVRRCCTDGAPNACSMLYRAAWRAVKALGYRKVITYTLPEEAAHHSGPAGSRSPTPTQAADAGTAPDAAPPTRTQPARSSAGSYSHERHQASTPRCQQQRSRPQPRSAGRP